jgi:uncharacterized membrane protein (UPF0127 family)
VTDPAPEPDPVPEAVPEGARRPRARRVTIAGMALVAVGAILVAVAAFGGRDDAPAPRARAASAPGAGSPLDRTVGSTAPGELGSGRAPERRGRTPLRGFGEVAATITSGSGEVCEVCLLAATTTEQRARGLMEVTDRELGGYDGMVFVYPDPTSGGFWMRNTPTPLSIAFFDGAGRLVSTTDMEPCSDSPTCPSYPADRPFAFALEVVEGRLDDVGVSGTATIRIDGPTCPLAEAGG